MGRTRTCPIDGTPLGELDGDGVLEATCHGCRRRFRFAHGTLVEVAAQEHDFDVTVSFEVDVGAGAPHAMTETFLRERWRPVETGVEVDTTEQKLRRGGWQLVSIEPDGQAPVSAREPGDRATVQTVFTAIRTGLVVAFTVLLLALQIHWAFVFVAPLGIAIASILTVRRWAKTTTRQHLEPDELEALRATQIAE